MQINSRGDAWADSIIFSKHYELIAQGHDSWVFWARGEHEQDEHMQKIASYPEVCLDVLMTRIDGRAGFHSRGITRRLLRRLDEIDPDVVHLHVLLGYYINVKMLFNWLAIHRCAVIWTLHDCWAITGHCIHFTCKQCLQWRSGCAAAASCPQKREYPETYLGGDASVRWCYEQKRHCLTMLSPERMSLIAPSHWLADLVEQSYLSKYKVSVVHNPVNTDVFRPTISGFRDEWKIGDRFLVLGVASKWSERKRLDVFVQLANELDSTQFAVVVVGVTERQKRFAHRRAENIIALSRTDSQRELAEIYTAADIFLNPSIEETFGMNVAEAEACGTASIVIEGSACAEVAKDAVTVSPSLDGLLERIQALRAKKEEETSHGK